MQPAKNPTERQSLNFAFDFSSPPTEHSLLQYLKECLDMPVSLALTDNSTTMLSATVRTGILRVRLHRMFCTADGPLLSEIASYLKNGKGPMPLFRRFIRERKALLRTRPPKKVPLKTDGVFFDLRELYREINEDYFGGAVNAAITWGSRSPRSSVRRRTLGSYTDRSNTIRINPVLDRKQVPRYFVAFIVYHEMLHAAMGTTLTGKRRSIHSREFRRREKLYREYARAMEWERGRSR